MNFSSKKKCRINNNLILLAAIIILSIPIISLSSFINNNRKLDSASTISFERINELIAQNNFSGSLLISLYDSIIYNNSFGYRDSGFREPNNDSTIYPIASITKLFVKHMVLNLINEEVLNPDDRLSEFIPEIYSAQEINIEHLLNHTSGLPDIHNELEIFQSVKTLPLKTKPENLIQLITKFKHLHFTPGTQYRYSNSNYVILASIIEKVTGFSLEQNLNENIFKPFGMRNTGLYKEHYLLPQHARGYFRNNGQVCFMPDFNFLNFWGSGNGYSTVTDLYRYAVESKKRLQPDIYNKLVSHTGYFAGINTAFKTIPEIGVCIIVLGNNGDCNAQLLVNGIMELISAQFIEIPVKKDIFSGNYEGVHFGVKHNLEIVFDSESSSLDMNEERLKQIKENIFILPQHGYSIATFAEIDNKANILVINDNGILIKFSRISTSTTIKSQSN